MKKKLATAISLSVLSTLAIGTGVVLSHKEVKEAEGYTAASLPTTIDLNDTSATNIRSYYSALNNLTTSERQGTNLLKNLKTILKNGQKYYSYDSGSAIWQIYEISDRDWDKSPASSTTYGTYNSSTNKITGYSYGTSASSSKNNPYIHALYINRNVTNQTTAWDDHQQTQWGINREHVWPKAEGFETAGAGGARGDPMHLMAGNGYANNIHSNYYYGYVNTSSSYTNCGTKYSNVSGNLLGKSKTLGGSTNVFEPQDCDKGDIARAIFYMVARYNYLSGSDSDGIDSNNPNLTLTQSLSDWASSGYSSTTSKTGKMGILTDLLAWHKADPVDDFERHRNNLLYTNFTNNRNPFIDFPEWADFIWGTATYNGSTYQSYNSNPTGYAQPNSDTINGYNSGSSSIAVTSVSLDKTSITLEEGETETLSATIAPANATNQGVSWSTSNSSVATVSNGIVTAVSEGSAVITVTTDDGNKTATCSVTVTPGSGSGGEDIPDGDAFIYSGSLAEGDYVIVYNNKAMKNTTSSSRLEYSNVTISSDVINSPSSDIIWHIAPSGNYWTIYNASVSKYAAGNGTKNQAQLLASGSDNYSLWTVSGDSTYEFVNKGNAAAGVNSNLRNNGTYGFACYSTSTGDALSLYKISESSPEPTEITATANKAFYVGEHIYKSDITVTDNLGNTITDFDFEDDGYMFVYEDTGLGGYSSTDKEFEISYNGMYTTLEVEVLRYWYVEPTSSEKTINDFSDITATYYSDAGNFVVTPSGDDVTYYGENVYRYSDALAFNYEKVSDGVYKTTSQFYNSTPFDTSIVNVDVTMKTGNNQLTIKPTVYYSNDCLSWVETNSGNNHYFLLKYPGTFSYGYIDIERIDITLAGEETAENVANFIMYEDVDGQCVDKLDTAIGLFNNMSKSERAAFMTATEQSNYVLYKAHERLDAWLLNQGKTISYDNESEDYVVSPLNNMLMQTGTISEDVLFTVLLISVLSMSTFACYIIIKKKKQEQ